MPLNQPFPGHTLKATFDDIRRDLEGLIVRDAAGKPRAGVFPDHTGELFTRQNNMTIGVKAFRAAQVRGGVVLLSNDGVTMVTIPPAPSANRRIDLVYVTARSTAAPWSDTADTPTFGVQQGAASATPVAPTLPANLADALPLFTVETAAAATTTQSAIITQVFPYTASAGGTVLFRSLVELSAWTAGEGARAHVLNGGGEYVRGADGWKRRGTIAHALVTNDTQDGIGAGPVRIRGVEASFSLPAETLVECTIAFRGLGTNQGNVLALQLRDGTTVLRDWTRPANSVGTLSANRQEFSARVPLSAGDHTLTVWAFKADTTAGQITSAPTPAGPNELFVRGV
ncbi:hypothetical protein ACFSWE_08675 [Leucobacter albus]|uniref:Uncharacterized protein n=1 Tax=Leucobacter albus TaxID=272210 RepID=A0ABW3TTJ1_9MICO